MSCRLSTCALTLALVVGTYEFSAAAMNGRAFEPFDYGGDLVIWQRQFKPAPAALPMATGVPEPGALALVGLGSVALLVGRRKAGSTLGTHA